MTFNFGKVCAITMAMISVRVVMKVINLTEPMPKKVKAHQVSEWPIWALAFRPYFLVAGVLAVGSMSYWLLMLSGYANWHLTVPATLWHAHEMLFGFSGVVAMGFLLTAAQTWTGVPSVSGSKLCLMTGVWLLARLSFFLPAIITANFNLYVVGVFQLIWWLAGIITLSNMLLKASSKQNYVFIVIASMLCTLNMIFLALMVAEKMLFALSVVDTAVIVMTLLVGIVAGRVVPFFTARGLNLTEQVRLPRLDKLVVVSSLFAIAWFFFSQLFFNQMSVGWVFTWLACLHFYRCVAWWHKGILKVPLLWSLHLSYWALSIGLLLIALSSYSSFILFKDALHFITVGTIGLMILAMMVRVSYGHTGRPLKVPFIITLAFVCIAVAAIIRALLISVIGHHLAWQLSAMLWIAGFLLFLFHCAPILVKRRVDGRVG